MDGVGITQDAILVGEDFTYRFELSNTQAGTFWGLVPSNRSRCASELSHIHEFRARGHFSDAGEYWNRAMAGLNMSVPRGQMEVIKIDGGSAIAPVTALEIGILYRGERVDVVTSPTDAGSMLITLDAELVTMQNSALTQSRTFQRISPLDIRPSHKNPEEQIPGTTFDLSTARSLQQQTLPPTASQTLLIYTHIKMLAHYDHVSMGYMNRTNRIPQPPALISLPKEEWDEHQLMPEIVGNGGWVDIIVNNLDKDAGHPFHLVQALFYPSQPWTRLSPPHQPRLPSSSWLPNIQSVRPPSEAALMYPEPNLVDPPLKDTVHISRRGYVILRIRADNPGLWFFHCHILWHAGTGMAM
ncbi:uncharacterized protein PAC_03205 [Phialocephala subalpina]|uniref:Plastocyanin-like domain-containing protein n=1 Tax=Phialocephala subalpina TaxID=576137 RepID=A0A1L7WKM3_9HELO|nr:uncharacterized protein PAC_03205 [Phialocephala subalpina]